MKTENDKRKKKGDFKMIHPIKTQYIYNVNVYYSVPADNAFGEEFIDVVNEYFCCDSWEEADKLMNYYCDLYRNNKGYTIEVTPMIEDDNCRGFKVIK